MGLELRLWLPWDSFSLVFPTTFPGWLLLTLYVLGLLALVMARRRDFARWQGMKWGGFSVALLLLFFTHRALVLSRLPSTVAFVGAPTFLPDLPSLSLLSLLVVVGGTIWLGVGPGAVLGFVAGLLRVGFHGQPLLDAFAFVAWAVLAGYLICQPYVGLLFEMLRHPLVALVFSTLAPLVVFGINRFAETLGQGLVVALGYGWESVTSALLLWLLGGLFVGGVFEALMWLKPGWWPRSRREVAFVTRRSLRARFLLIIVVPLLMGLFVSVLAVTSRGMGLARNQAIQEMTRSATNASESVQNFYYTGANLLDTFVTNPLLLDPQQREAVLELDLKVVPFFQELLLTDSEGEVSAIVPSGVAPEDRVLTEEETTAVYQALTFGIAQQTRLTELPSGVRRLTFVQPLFTENDEAIAGALLGRVDLEVNPVLQRALEALQLTRGAGLGFILDDRGVIVVHPEAQRMLRPWTVSVNFVEYPVEVGRAYEDIGPDGERLLTHVREVRGVPAVLVLQLPFSVVLETATAISNPILAVQLATSLVLLLLIPLLAARVTSPLQDLAQGARHIAEGNLSVPVHVSGADEVGQLGRAFEQMRERLRARLNDLSLLLGIAQAVSATLELEEGMPLILEGALEETGAATARFVLLHRGTNRPRQTFAVGLSHPAFASLDRVLCSALYRRRAALINPDLQREQSTPLFVGPLQGLAAFPVRSQNRTVAVLWVGAREQEVFDEARVNFLSTLASQAAVLVENARLFHAAEGGRQRLAAILASTTDAILVTDQEQRLLLINPAARRVLGLDDSAYGRPVTNLNLPAPLEQALLEPPEEEQGLPAVEVPLADGRTFYASIAPITAADRDPSAGRVIVLRDITHFKELDEMKSDFVATVSHDLRAPLTFIRGYATMLMMVGDLNEKQQEYLERILDGIEQMSALIGDLLNLRRIEAGVGIKREPTALGVVLVEAVDNMRARAMSKGISLHLEPSDGSPVVTGDRTLLRQALSNLVDNAIKYTLAGGEVKVGLELRPSEQSTVIHVTDTGIGIAPEDQLRLFEKFHRISRRETGNISGTGLGLALVKSIVGHHGGRVWVESALNQGSTFYVELPLRIEDEET